MIKAVRRRILLILPLTIIFIFTTTSSEMMAQEDTVVEVEEKLSDISDEERQILESLFIQAQEVEKVERQKDKLTEDIQIMREDIVNLEDLIDETTKEYDERVHVLEQVLRSYQRMGPSSYIDIILDADSITNLLRRINTLRDLTRNTGELLESVDEIKKNLEEEKDNLDNKLLALEQREDDLKSTIDEGQQKVKELEEQLDSLEGDREYYEERLESMMVMMNEFTILMAELTKEFSNIIEEGNLSEDAIEYGISTEGIKASIREEVFNQVIEENSDLPEFILHFYPERVEMELPDRELFLVGSFVIIDDQVLKFEVEEGSFYNMVLKNETIQAFFEEGYFILNLESLIWNNVLKKVETSEGYIELTVELNLN